MAMPLGHFTFNFLSSPAKVSTKEFAGIAFLIAFIAIYWSHFVNDL